MSWLSQCLIAMMGIIFLVLLAALMCRKKRPNPRGRKYQTLVTKFDDPLGWHQAFVLQTVDKNRKYFIDHDGEFTAYLHEAKHFPLDFFGDEVLELNTFLEKHNLRLV